MDDGTCSRVSFSTDVLVEILQRLPPNSRRRSRLVCRRWRDAVDERTATDLRSRAKTLLVTDTYTFVVHDDWSMKPVMTGPEDYRAMQVVGTCNGLVCLCDDSQPGGAITLANPANGERLDLPPLPCADVVVNGRLGWHEAYGFTHDQRTGLYKVVHLPCCFDRVWEFQTLQVFTLGEASWRDVATPAAGVRCLRKAGIVSVHGATYWVADGTTGRIMSLDLEEERVASVQPLPVPLPKRFGSTFHLAEVHGRVGAVIFHNSTQVEKTEVWVLESLMGERRWRRWYCVETNPRVAAAALLHRVTLPHFAHGRHVLTHRGGTLYGHEPDGTRKKSLYGMVKITDRSTGKVADIGRLDQAFAYVETKEPLNIYKLW